MRSSSELPDRRHRAASSPSSCVGRAAEPAELARGEPRAAPPYAAWRTPSPFPMAGRGASPRPAQGCPTVPEGGRRMVTTAPHSPVSSARRSSAADTTPPHWSRQSPGASTGTSARTHKRNGVIETRTDLSWLIREDQWGGYLRPFCSAPPRASLDVRVANHAVYRMWGHAAEVNTFK